MGRASPLIDVVNSNKDQKAMTNLAVARSRDVEEFHRPLKRPAPVGLNSFISQVSLTSLRNIFIMASAVAGPSTKPVTPFYCGVCSLPTEYCEFGPSFSKCKSWLEDKDTEEYSRLWGEGDPNSLTRMSPAYQ